MGAGDRLTEIWTRRTIHGHAAQDQRPGGLAGTTLGPGTPGRSARDRGPHAVGGPMAPADAPTVSS
jgi:hypothetical protein